MKNSFQTWISSPARENDHKTLKNLILGSKTFCVGRIGGGEVTRNPATLAKHVGVVPATKEQMEIFDKEYTKSIQACTAMGRWNAQWFPNETQELKRRGMSNSVVEFHAETLGDVIFNMDNPEKGWFHALANKKILVVHPFVKTMKAQYEKRTDFFPTFPNFASIAFLQAPLTNCMSESELKEYKSSWIQNLEHLVDVAGTIDFDIALIGCGGYAMPFGARIKEKYNKSSITLGGACQLYFGIIGNRWLTESGYSHVKNRYERDKKHWVRPADDEKPAMWKTLESGCYW